MMREPGFYWARDEKGKLTVLQVGSGDCLQVTFIGSLYLMDIEEAEAEFRILERISEPVNNPKI